MDLCNTGILPQHYMASQLKRQLEMFTNLNKKYLILLNDEKSKHNSF